jgi:hypothetical protein
MAEEKKHLPVIQSLFDGPDNTEETVSPETFINTQPAATYKEIVSYIATGEGTILEQNVTSIKTSEIVLEDGTVIRPIGKHSSTHSIEGMYTGYGIVNPEGDREVAFIHDLGKSPDIYNPETGEYEPLLEEIGQEDEWVGISTQAFMDDAQVGDAVKFNGEEYVVVSDTYYAKFINPDAMSEYYAYSDEYQDGPFDIKKATDLKNQAVVEDPFVYDKPGIFGQTMSLLNIFEYGNEIINNPSGKYTDEMKGILGSKEKKESELESKIDLYEDTAKETKDDKDDLEADLNNAITVATNNAQLAASGEMTNIQELMNDNILSYHSTQSDKLMRFELVLPQIFSIALHNRQGPEFAKYMEDQKREATSRMDDSLSSLQSSLEELTEGLIEDYNKTVGEWNDKLLDMQKEILTIATEIDQLELIASLTTAKFWQSEATMFDKMVKGGTVLGLIFGGLAKIATGMARDVLSLAEGDIAALGRLVATTVKIVAIVAAFKSGYFYLAYLLITEMVISLDAMYANGAVLSGVLKILDVILNEVLRLDHVMQDLSKLDPDHDKHMDIVGVVRITVSVVATIASVRAYFTSEAYRIALKQAMGSVVSTVTGAVASIPIVGDMYTVISQLLDKLNTLIAIDIGKASLKLSDLWDIAKSIINIIKAIGYKVNIPGMPDLVYPEDEIEQGEAKVKAIGNEITNRLNDSAIKLNSKFTNTTRNRMLMHMKDSKDMMSDSDEIINEFLLQVMGDTAGYLDPEGLIAKNSRYSYTPTVAFGYEDMFNASNFAGNEEYFKKMLYGSYDI